MNMSFISDFGMLEDTITIKEEVSSDELPIKSKGRYERCYRTFCDWKSSVRAISNSEGVLLAYFQHLKIKLKYKASSLWTSYSMLGKTIQMNDNITISGYRKLLTFLKKEHKGYLPKQTKLLSEEQISTFLNEAPDERYLLQKVILAFGIAGGLRRQEIHDVTINNIAVKGDDTALITIPKSNGNKPRSFGITGPLFELYSKYAKLRPSDTTCTNLFINYCYGKCTKQQVGVNKIGAVPKRIAEYLELPDPHLYTGHCFRRSGASISVSSGAYMTARLRKRSRDCQSVSVAESSVEVNLNPTKKIKNEPVTLEPMATLIPNETTTEPEEDPLGDQTHHVSGEMGTSRRPAASIFVSSGAEMVSHKQSGDWQSVRVGEGYVEVNINPNKNNVNQQVAPERLSSLTPNETTTEPEKEPSGDQTHHITGGRGTLVQISNCSNCSITINICEKK